MQVDAEAEKLRKAVGDLIDEAVGTLRRLVQIPSVTGNEKAAQEFYAYEGQLPAGPGAGA